MGYYVRKYSSWNLEVVGLNIPERVDGMGNLTDGELVARVRQGNQEAFSELISRYYGLLQWKISGYRKLGIDADDLLQEATLGLLDSVMSFQEGKGASFETYATVCVNNPVGNPLSGGCKAEKYPFSFFGRLSGGNASRSGCWGQ